MYKYSVVPVVRTSSVFSHLQSEGFLAVVLVQVQVLVVRICTSLVLVLVLVVKIEKVEKVCCPATAAATVTAVAL